MKSYKQDKALMKLLDARQLGLKLIANVTFGYAAANYSGRMPSVEVSSSKVIIRYHTETMRWRRGHTVPNPISSTILGLGLFSRNIRIRFP